MHIFNFLQKYLVKLPIVEYDHDTNTYKVNEAIKTNIKVNSLPVATTFIIFDE